MTLAARTHALDGKIHLDEVEPPEPGADQVLFQPAFAGVNPIDRYVAEGKVAAGGPLPRTLGSEASGWCDGRPVLVTHPTLGATRDGVWATACVVPRAAVVPLPEGVDLLQGAAMGVAGLTAWNVVHLAEVRPADRVLVLGATGGVGLSVVSVAAAIGATVWGQTGSAAKSAVVLEQGAAHVLTTDAEGLPAALGDWEPTVVIDPLGAGFTAAALGLLRAGGRHVIFGTSAGPRAEIQLQHLYRNGIRLHGYGGLQLSDEDRKAGLTAALEALREGRLRITVGRLLPLRDAEDAFEVLADRAVVGKVILETAG
jgi:NADPH2:quinone reductase